MILRVQAWRWRLVMALAGALGLLVVAACSSSDTVASTPTDESLRIASFDFAESELLAEFYAQLAEGAEIPVTRLGRVGPREVVSPALESGVIDLIPEYLGTALSFAGGDAEVRDPEIAVNELSELLHSRGLVVLEPAPAEDINVFVVQLETARAAGLVDVSDLTQMEGVRFGGPVECPDRPHCLLGLADTYGVNVDEFVPQNSLMFTAESLRRGEIDVGLLFSTSPELDDGTLRVLRDDQRLQPPENVVPIVRADALERWGSELSAELNRFGAELTTSELRRLNRRIASGEPMADVVSAWLESNLGEREES